jgi:signal transduction histidine kinase
VRAFASDQRARVPVAGPTEVGELAAAFNEMAGEIERARASEQAFLADISHELRTPLTSIHGFAQAIAEGEARGDGVARAAEPLPVMGDPDRLSQLFINVLDNAVKHSPRGATVRVNGERMNGEVIVRVRDQGTGLPPGTERKLFARFWRGDNAAARAGAGLGLAIAQAIAQAHGGSIDARNAPGGGAEFAIHLPASP